MLLWESPNLLNKNPGTASLIKVGHTAALHRSERHGNTVAKLCLLKFLDTNCSKQNMDNTSMAVKMYKNAVVERCVVVVVEVVVVVVVIVVVVVVVVVVVIAVAEQALQYWVTITQQVGTRI